MASKKPMFHAPQRTGKVTPVPMNTFMKVISAVSLLVLLALTAFVVYGVITRGGQMLEISRGYFMNAAFLFILLAVIAWLIAIGFRLAIRLIPLEMWRLPVSVREATIKTKGKYLKLATLLIELETAIAFCYIAYSLYNGKTPGDIPILVWVAAVAATIIFFGRYVKIEAQRQ